MVIQTTTEFTMVDKLEEIKKLVADCVATENPMAFYDYIVEAMKGRPIDDSFRRDLEGFRHNIEWSHYLGRFVVSTFDTSQPAALNLTSMRFTCAKDDKGNPKAETTAAKVILEALSTGDIDAGREAYRKVLRKQLNTGINRKVKKMDAAASTEPSSETRDFLSNYEIYRSGKGRALRDEALEKGARWLGYSLRNMVLPPASLDTPSIELWDQLLESARAVVEEDRKANRLPDSLYGESVDSSYVADILFTWSVDRMIFGHKVPEFTGVDAINAGLPLDDGRWYYRANDPIWSFWTLKRELGLKQYTAKSTAGEISDRLREIVKLPDYDHVEQLKKLIKQANVTEIDIRDCYARDILCETLA